MLKHIGRHGDRKVAILFREVPNEEHMCLVIYPDVLPTHIHDSIMKTLESAEGQSATQLADACHRKLLPDGRPMLQTLHAEGMIKKVQAKQVVVTPNASSHVNLDEMNGIIRKMKMGEQAIKEMADIDANRGITGKARRRDDFGREVGAPVDGIRAGSAAVAGSDAARALDDAQLARDRLAQAQRMETEARGLLAESARLKAEAEAMAGGQPKPKAGRTKKVRAADAA